MKLTETGKTVLKVSLAISTLIVLLNVGMATLSHVPSVNAADIASGITLIAIASLISFLAISFSHLYFFLNYPNGHAKPIEDIGKGVRYYVRSIDAPATYQIGGKTFKDFSAHIVLASASGETASYRWPFTILPERREFIVILNNESELLHQDHVDGVRVFIWPKEGFNSSSGRPMKVPSEEAPLGIDIDSELLRQNH